MADMNITGKHTSASPEETIALGVRIAKSLTPGTVIALSGELGAGKTCLSQGIAKGLNVHQAVSSPTFTVINEYAADLPLNHIDLYRLTGPDEALAIGIEDYLFGEGVTLIEWPERCMDLLPPGTLHVQLSHLDKENSRAIEVSVLPGASRT